MKYYVTLFDSNYLTRGLVMYRSLLSHAGDFHLWIICFDELAYQILERLNLERVTLVSLLQFEDPELLGIKSTRTRQEYCWTCTPSTLLYVLNTEAYVDRITYLDADLMFFSSPEPIFTEAEEAPILLTEHRYMPKFDQSATSGLYNVQFMSFRRDRKGLTALNWWRDRCIEWCFARIEDNKFGDQKYLDDWLERFSGVHVIQTLGAGLAPWNAAQYYLKKIEEKVYVEKDLLIFYHYHSLKIHSFNIGYCSAYPLNYNLYFWIYRPYFQEIYKTYQDLKIIVPHFDLGIVPFVKLPDNIFDLYELGKMTIKEIIRGKYCKYA